ncbi:hypothetical protein [Auraticoccus monumenti]|uniref:HicA toxin of toxin-antitoxin n=1 Tax=Auraticoccus monumenti TaxID=675864 RepID=A0A1G6UMG1_9ACTN|nr:hypothetical protein [Auraticoccus monumenti]SDD41906.1 hypothetical protein SAMN04489747_0909 [Auraticoccus monumenti]
MNKDTKKVIKALEEQGFTCITNRRGHTHVSLDGVHVTWLAGSPSDHRSWKNAIAALRRAGFEWPR